MASQHDYLVALEKYVSARIANDQQAAAEALAELGNKIDEYSAARIREITQLMLDEGNYITAR